MSDSSGNFWETKSASEPATPPAYVPPPPSEVNIRTMESDLKSMSGNGESAQSVAVPMRVSQPADTGNYRSIIAVAAILFSAALAGSIFYFYIYPKFLKGIDLGMNAPIQSASPASQAPLSVPMVPKPVVPAIPSVPPFTHQSFFVK